MTQTDLFGWSKSSHTPIRCTITVRAMALSDPAWESVPVKRELVFPIGAPPSNDDRRWAFTPEDLAAVVADFDGRAEKIPVLYRHGDDPVRGGMAAGWIDALSLAVDGLYADIRYNERALAEIKDGGWGYRSPGFDAEQDENGAWHPRRLSEVSLVNDPAIAGMPPLQARKQAPAEPVADPTEAASKDAPTTPRGEQEEQSMGDSQTVTAAKKQKSAAFDKPGVLALLRDTYAMPDAVSDEMLLKLLEEALMGKPAEAPEQPEMDMEKEPANPLADAPAGIEDAEKKKKLPCSVQPPAITLDAEAEKADREKVRALVARAYSEGKVTAATLEGAIRYAQASPEGFEEWAAVAPVIAPPDGQVIKASAADRAPQSAAARLTEKYRNEAAQRRHFTQRSA